MCDIGPKRQTADVLISLSLLLSCLPHAQQRFSAVIMRLRDPKSTALIFESGKMVVLGAKEENQVSSWQRIWVVYCVYSFLHSF